MIGFRANPFSVREYSTRGGISAKASLLRIPSQHNSLRRSATVDVILLYDVLQVIKDRDGLLQEFNRVLKPSGIVSVDWDHLRPVDVQKIFDRMALFTLLDQEEGLFRFTK